MRMPAGSLRSNIGLPYISQYVLRGCGSSVYSTLTAQPFLSAYLICAVICASVRSGRNENWPCVMRFPVLVIMAAFLDFRKGARRPGAGRDPALQGGSWIAAYAAMTKRGVMRGTQV